LGHEGPVSGEGPGAHLGGPGTRKKQKYNHPGMVNPGEPRAGENMGGESPTNVIAELVR